MALSKLTFSFFFLSHRLGFQVTSAPKEVVQQPQQKIKSNSRRFESPRRFDSSLGSDTGTSTRESECSGDHSPPATSPPNMESNAKIFDSLAAELRAKLSGNGPPLLLPPRDYDTVHRAQGNLAAIELRRFVAVAISLNFRIYFEILSLFCLDVATNIL